MNSAPVTAPVPPILYPLLAYISLSAGLLATGMFVVQEKNTLLAKQVQTSLIAALFLGFGTIFTSISVGVYV
ncbi:hypothetical protein PHYBLDRAFT_24833 [Phycomyces blakesleeanus NRRL 1555(-)]|uniref:Dolichyl-diphosphooligosaccharide-protein glycosyltransferase subunit OST5 n=2 Tax=Phycomyces blakesleeanus TaxID=4837 RepID=A0A167K0G7_PHYB8|nr:hypothetical protein PHYBLDRAFT_24833 [Phycomyces blakesleeanus NRRL 1555(-)]OAD67019.1 hypothetical protein PHYBLDRAFT_24833 [Phycomyces blakesleeanus NRRL 1555(-)]|eukprot:XP_018285059.1 hypothetical protein PHYBLDRAFT_24833 [Phycomyces blakesleeanus NRRL 1555(-)]